MVHQNVHKGVERQWIFVNIMNEFLIGIKLKNKLVQIPTHVI